MYRRRVGRGSGRQLPATSPHNQDDVDVAESHEDGRNNEDIGRQEGEVELTLPPGRVSSTSTLVLDHSLGVHADGHLQIDQLRFLQSIIAII